MSRRARSLSMTEFLRILAEPDGLRKVSGPGVGPAVVAPAAGEINVLELTAAEEGSEFLLSGWRFECEVVVFGAGASAFSFASEAQSIGDYRIFGRQ